jgi:hypothetical protein
MDSGTAEVAIRFLPFSAFALECMSAFQVFSVSAFYDSQHSRF